MSTSTRDDYREVSELLTPSAVSQYLAARRWVLEASQRDIREIWRLPGDADGDRARIMLPLATDFVDFRQRFTDALLALGKIYGSDPDELQERILATRADLFFVRLDQAVLDGTIPFRQAEATIESLHKMLKAAATTAADPYHSHVGRRPARVREFLEDDVRLGHTKKGSFVFTVVTRLSDPESAEPAQDRVVQGFPRKVMETLARGLQTTRGLAQHWDSQVLDAPGDFGVSAGLVESLEEMTQPQGLRALDLSFQWAAGEEPPQVDGSSIVLDRDVIAALPTVRERLVRQEEPPREETLRGLVTSLHQEAFEDEETAEVVVKADVHGRMRNVRMRLTGEDHQWAILAYQHKLPFTVTGDLAFERRAWWLTGDVRVDSSFLLHTMENSDWRPHAPRPAPPDA
ncbi:hypothetical protein ACFW95_39075 [Streptomyces sp. NPDC059474]|uniref:hypothetical protein n=1 Tax=unclassified Streptomyces TaxID=2593676 RepID=UPI0036C9F62E